MERYTCNGAYLEKFSNGAFVKYSDHVAEVGKITDQLESLRTTLCSSLAAHSDHAAELAEWKQRAERAEAYVAGQDLRSDFRTAGEMRAALDVALRENTLLRAECESARKCWIICNHEYTVKGEDVDALASARAATDAANILKGAE